MDNFELAELVSLCPVIKYRFAGCFAQDKHLFLYPGTFQLVNTANHGEVGEHWLLFARPDETYSENFNMVIFYDSYGRVLRDSFSQLYNKVANTYDASVNIVQIFPSASFVQSSNTTLCGLYCLYAAHSIFAGNSASGSAVIHGSEEKVLRFAAALFGKNFVRRIEYL